VHNCWLHLVFAVVASVCAVANAAEITLFEFPDFGDRRITLLGSVPNFDPGGFNDRAESMLVRAGYWELCSDAYFRDRWATFGPGEYRGLQPSLVDAISSAREVAGSCRRHLRYVHRPS
jgi:hypothetical protein